MTTIAATPESFTDVDASRRRALRRLVAGAAPFDAVMGIGCLLAGSRIGGWLSVSSGTVRGTGVVFLVAAVTGAQTLRARSLDARWIAAANAAFAAWCLAAVGFAGANAAGTALLVVSAVASAGTAVTELKLGGRR